MKTASQEVISEYCDYIIGEQVRGLEAKDQAGVVVARPQWSQILHYDFQIRKEMAKLIHGGADFAAALRQELARRAAGAQLQLQCAAGWPRPPPATA